MSSKARQGQAGESALCRIGERVLLGYGPQGAVAGKAKRRLDFKAGEAPFAAFLMGRDADAAPAIGDIGDQGLPEFAKGAGLSDSDYTSFLRAVFETVAPMFRLARDERFKALTEQLLAHHGDLPAGTARADRVEGFGTAVVTVPARLKLTDESLIVTTGDDIAVGRVDMVASFLARDNEKERLAAVDFSAVPAEGRSLVITPKGLALLDLSIASHAGIEAFRHAHKRSPDHVSLLACCDRDAGSELDILWRREKRSASISEPVLGLQFHLSKFASMPHGLFLSGWFIDPDGLVGSVAAVDHSLEDAVVSDHWLLASGRTKVGEKTVEATRFAAFLRRREAFDAPNRTIFRVQLKNGESHLAWSPLAPQDRLSQRTAILDALAGRMIDREALENVYGPALGVLQAEINDRQSVHEVVEHGVRSSRKVSIIVPLYKETGFIRSQLVAFDVDPYVRAHCEIVYVLDDPLLANRVRNILSGSAKHVHRLDLKLVILERNGGYALANNFGVGAAGGETLVLMNSDVIPEKAGWLEPLIATLDGLPSSSVVGPKLLYADESLQHAGMFFERLATSFWQNMHYHKGYGRAFPPADAEREVPAVTGALMVLRKADFLDVGGFTPDYVVGDYEDSDLCLKLRAKGGTCRYVPSVALFHFERQSMQDSDDIDLGSTIYNRALHTSRWNDAIEALMARFDGAIDGV